LPKGFSSPVKQFLLNPLTWLLLMLLILIIAYLVLLIDIDYSSDIPVDRGQASTSHYDLLSRLKTSDASHLKDNFPYKDYLDSGNFHDAISLQRDLGSMNSVTHDEMLSQEVLSIALTEKLLDRVKPSFEKYNPDSLIRLLQWSEKFNAWSEMDEKNSLFYKAVYDYWCNFISNTLAEYYEVSYAVKYNYKFRYLSDRLREKQYNTPVRGTWSEKVITQMIRKNWSYLFNKFWHSTTLLYKSLVFLLILILIFPYFYIISKSIPKTFGKRRQ
jgi:hypothetical protein